MRRLFVLSLVAVAAFATAAPGPRPSVFDAVDGSSDRVRYVDYNDSLVIRLQAFRDHSLVIEFGDGELVREIAGGGLVTGSDLQKGVLGSWEVAKSGGRVFVRPLADNKRTTMLVVTSKSRTYVVDLSSSSPAAKEFERRVARVVVRPPRPPAPTVANVAVPAPVVSPAASAATPTEPADEARPVARIHNEEYSMEVVALSDDIRPTQVYDDGRFTYFRFAANLPIPAIYKSVPGTTDEWLINSHIDGEYVVVHGVGRLWNLRLDRSVVGVFNDAFDAMGAPAVDGSTVANQKRVRR